MQSKYGIEDLFIDSPSVETCSVKPQTDVKNDIINLFEKVYAAIFYFLFFFLFSVFSQAENYDEVYNINIVHALLTNLIMNFAVKYGFFILDASTTAANNAIPTTVITNGCCSKF